jgi:tetratricopeptide (TPR) repeat protein
VPQAGWFYDLGVNGDRAPTTRTRSTLRIASLAALFACAAFAQNHHAKIVVEGGAELPGVPLLMPLPADMLVGECVIYNVFGNGMVVYSVPWVRDENGVPDGCRVTIRLTGYRATNATLTEGSVVILKRIGDTEGSTVSVTSLRAPKAARQAYQRGLTAANHKRYDEAAKAFEAAVAAYPQYAQAWSELGQAQLALNRPADARASWERAVKSDPQYLKPYVQLARLAVAEDRNLDAADITNRGLAFSPVEFPAIYFYNAVANFNLKDYDAAGRSATETIAHDLEREFPEVERLLGSIFAAKGDLTPAIAHFRKYLELVPKAADSDVISNRITELEDRRTDIGQVSLAGGNPLERELETLAASPEAGNTAASVSVPYFFDSSGAARVSLAIEIPSPVLNPAELGGKLHAEMDVLGLAYNLKSKVVARFSDTVKFDFDSRRQLDDFLKRPLHYEHQFGITPGTYRFKLVFRTTKDRFGVVETPLAVDPFDPGRLSLSSIALSRGAQPISQEAAQEETEAGSKPLIFRGNRITVSGSDVLPRTDAAEAYFEVYQPPAAGTGAVRLTARLRLLDALSEQKWDSGDVDLSALTRSGKQVIPVALKLPISTLPPGAYHGELTVKDSGGSQASRSVQFRAE